MYDTADKKHILHLPKWYPHPVDPQNGVFIRKQIESVGSGFRNTVLFVKSANQKPVYKIESLSENQVESCVVFFREFNGLKLFKPIVHFWRYFIGFKKGLGHIIAGNGKPDLIHAHVLLRTGLLANYYSIKFKIRFLVSEHWSGYITGTFYRKGFIYRSLSKFVFKKASKILVVSETLKSALLKLGMPKQKIEVVPNVVETHFSSDNKTEIKERNSVIMLSVADLVDDIKKISEVIETVASLSNEHKLEYWIVGDGDDRQSLEELARSKGLLGTAIKFFGRKTNEEVLKIIGQSDFLVMNSVFETFSVVTAESLLAGKPVVATRCGGPEMFVNETNGILIEVGDRPGLHKALIKMTQTCKDYDPKVLKSGISERFCSDVVGKQLESVYDKILD